ncbi:MAG: hypothetical protein A2W85_11160 [Bacteroidetes bacterium GWF2_41_31]|nr:MAG: hypothetical protein A2W85_11160 [Bacteroidetes bacterium GWF2_41_31]
MKKSISFILTAIVMASVTLVAQNDTVEWGWQWGRSAQAYTEPRIVGIETDFNNDFYAYYWYADSITIGDTSFIHYGNNPNHQFYDVAIARHDQNGNFIRALDIYTTVDHFIWDVEVRLDHESNIYIYGTYSDTLFVNNHILTNNHDFMPDLFLVKLSSNFEFIWGKTISSSAQEFLGGFDISEDDYLYLSSTHAYYHDSIERYVNFLGQDSVPIGNGLNSIMKIDVDGNIIWQQEVRSFADGSMDNDYLIVGENGDIYCNGRSSTNFIVDGDTIIHPDYPDWGIAGFILHYDTQGNLRQSYFIDLDHFTPTTANGIKVDKSGNFYAAGMITESTIFGTDTITIPENSRGLLVARLDSLFQPKWCKYVDDYNKINGWLLIDLFEDKLELAMTGTNHFAFAGIDFSLGIRWNGILMQFDTSGNIINYQITQATKNLVINQLCADNCGNFLISGQLFNGTAYFGPDTLSTPLPVENFFAKNESFNIPPIDLPSDTSGCKELTLNAPKGYLYYIWNNEITNQDTFYIVSSGIVNLKVADEGGCWLEGESIVTIFPGIDFSLGEDTTMLYTDTLVLSVDISFESYLWSTGDTLPNVNIAASGLAIGNNQLWLEVVNGPCTVSDTLNIFVIDNSGTIEIVDRSVYLFPNPAKRVLTIVNPNNLIFEHVGIYNLSGLKLIDTKPLNRIIDVEKLQPGIYIVELVTSQSKIRRKLVIN